jgi:polar amino acid transport system substrate-binding protein
MTRRSSMNTIHRLAAPLAAAVALLLAASGCGAPQGATKATEAPTAYDQALHDSLPAEVRRSGVLRLATDASYAPASSFGPDGRTIVGFEPDLGAAIGRVLGVEVRFHQSKFSELLSDVRHGRTDLVMSAMTDTLQRERSADFVNYFSAGTAIVVQRGNPAGITDLAGLCDQVVAVEAGTIQVDLLARSQKRCGKDPIAVKTYDTNADALVQLRTGRAAAVLNDYPPAAHLASDPKTRSRFQLASTAQYEPGLYGIAVPKGRPQLRDAMKAALDKLMRSGEYADILARWDVADGGIKESAVNAGAVGIAAGGA